MLPIDISKTSFDKLDKLISIFIRQRKRLRIRLKTLKLSKAKGGLKLPNLRYYFWAVQLRPLTIWIQALSYTHWLNIEKSLCERPLQALPFLGANPSETEWVNGSKTH